MKIRPVDDARYLWKKASVQLAVLAGAAGAWFMANPDDWTAAVNALPEAVRPFAGLIMFGLVPVMVRGFTTAPRQDEPEE